AIDCKRVLEEIDIVALIEVAARMGAARFPAVESRMGHGLGHLELVSEFESREPFGVPSPRGIVEPKPPITPLELGQRIAGGLYLWPEPEDPAARFHALRHGIAQHSQALAARFIAQQTGGTPNHVVGLLFQPGDRLWRQGP